MNETTLNNATRHRKDRQIMVSFGGVEYPSTGFKVAKDKIVIMTEAHELDQNPFRFSTTEEQANSFYADVQEPEKES